MAHGGNGRKEARMDGWFGNSFLSVLFILIFLSFGLSNSSPEFPVPLPEFNEQNAYRHLVAQCDFGPRYPGITGHVKCREYLTENLRESADSVRLQEFGAVVGSGASPVPAFNIIARFQPDKKPRILLCAHWDTRPWADQDPDPGNFSTPITGANDGASGVAVLLEMARILSQNEPPVGVDLVLFDAEDLGDPETDEGWIQGSTYFVRNLPPSDYPRFGVLIDMIGDRDLQIHREDYSQEHARDVVDRIWSTAARLKLPAFKPSVKYPMLDDHIPFLQAGIPCVDLIDFDYPFWHTLADTPDKCSPESLAQVGTLLVTLIYAGD